MKVAITLALLLSSSLWGRGDLSSGPSRNTILTTSWGTIYYEPASLGPYQLVSTNGDFTLTSRQGKVAITGGEADGFKLTCGADTLTILGLNGGGGIEVREKPQKWTLRLSNGTLTLDSTSPKDKVVFNRNANTFTIQGGKGMVTVDSEPNELTIHSPLGESHIKSDYGTRSMSGPELDAIPYLGRGIFIPFHGAGVFLDISKLFPMPEVAEWLDWKPVLQP